MTKSRNINAPKHLWTSTERALLRDLYPDVPAADVAALLGISPSAVYNQADQLGLKKSPDFHASGASGLRDHALTNPNMIASRFRPGSTAWNKGMKGLYTPGSERGWFKPGRRPQTWLPVGSVRLTADGYLERKVNDLPGNNSVRWKGVHSLVWQAAHGPVPKGHIVIFKPGRRSTDIDLITLDAVECISRAENARRNHPRSKSPELGRLVQLRGAITRQINKRTRDNTPNQGATP